MNLSMTEVQCLPTLELLLHHVHQVLCGKDQLDPDHFASADAWMEATLTHHYPLALERIARGLTMVTHNPANILVSLSNGYIHCSWVIKRGVALVKSGGTHGGLDALCSDGILLSNFAPTRDTSTSRVAALYEGFKGLRDFHAEETGAEWCFTEPSELPPTGRSLPLATDGFHPLSGSDALTLRLWTPTFAHLESSTPIEVTLEKLCRFLPATIRHGEEPISTVDTHRQELQLLAALPAPHKYERLYLLRSSLALEPLQAYRLSWRINQGKKTSETFKFNFYTDDNGLPAAH